ncbi:MAG: pilus assembly protein, partial [Aestuariivirga sp.]|nr:pilus assembly protein [Aestuariivirga sp.]
MKFTQRGSAVERAARFGRAAEGATAVEFALVAAPFFFLLGGILEVGVMLLTEYRLQGAVDAAGRLLRTGQAAVSTPQQFAAAICENSISIPDCPDRIGFVVDSATRFADINMPDLANIGAGTRDFSPGGPNQAVLVVATVDWDFILPQMRLLSNLDNGTSRRLQGIAVFQ